MDTTCTCCGDSFDSPAQDPQHDTGFGVCPSCNAGLVKYWEADS